MRGYINRVNTIEKMALEMFHGYAIVPVIEVDDLIYDPDGDRWPIPKELDDLPHKIIGIYKRFYGDGGEIIRQEESTWNDFVSFWSKR